jgi:hypothetical protein
MALVLVPVLILVLAVILIPVLALAVPLILISILLLGSFGLGGAIQLLDLLAG